MNSTTRKIGAAFGLASIAAFSVALPASATTVGEWGVWASTEVDGQYNVTFTDPSMPDASVAIYDYSSVDIFSPDGEGEGFTAATPVGALVGANNNSTDYNFLKVETIADNNDCATVEITFDSAVPAEQLILAISDIDSDNATISMEDENGDPIAPGDIAGFDMDTVPAFNWDDLSNTDDIPAFSFDPSSTELYVGNAPDNTDGSTGWVQPTLPISFVSIVICTEDGNNSSQRIWLGQVSDGTASSSGGSLAQTGADKSIYLGVIAGGALLAAGGFVGMRRRNS